MTRASRKVASPRVVCVDDLRVVARRRVPKAVFDYLDGGAEGEVTLRENCRAFEEVTFRPRHAIAIPAVTSVLYPGLPPHPGHAIAARQMVGGFGGMLSIRTRAAALSR